MDLVMDRRGAAFDLDDDAAYLAWRAQRLARAPALAEDLIVPVADPLQLSAAERQALLDRCGRANMAVYRLPLGPGHTDEDHHRQFARAIGQQLGLRRLDANWLADEDGVSAITATNGSSGARGDFIPYTRQAIRWHTDGYYHPAARTIRGMVLHCVRPAVEGGDNALLDPELAYIALRDADPAHIRALSRPDALVIPARTDEQGVARAAQSGPVFSVDAAGQLHMRYTARTRSIAWKDDAPTRKAVACLEQILRDSPRVLRLRLEAGMGLLSNNVLHDRSGFVDDPDRPRLLLRARYLDRIGPSRPQTGG